MNDTKPGYATTEFWTTLITQILAVLSLFHPGLHAEKWTPITQAAAVLAAAAASGWYAHGRSKVKQSVITGQSLVTAEKAHAAKASHSS